MSTALNKLSYYYPNVPIRVMTPYILRAEFKSIDLVVEGLLPGGGMVQIWTKDIYTGINELHIIHKDLIKDCTKTMNSIPFIQFHRPDGRQTDTSINVDDETFAKWKVIRDLNFRMTIEIVSDNKVCLCIEDVTFGDFDCMVYDNNPNLPCRVKDFILRFEPERAVEWRKHARGEDEE